MNARRIHLILAVTALLLGGILWLGAQPEEAALCALFALACFHQAQHAGTALQLSQADQTLFLILRHLDELQRRLR